MPDSPCLDVVGRHLHHVVDERTEVLAVGGDALRTGTAVGRAVVAADPRDDELAVAFTGLHVCDACQLHGGVDGLAARAGEEHASVGDGPDGAELLGQLLGRVGGERIEARVGRSTNGCSACAIASAISLRPWPMAQYQRLAMPSTSSRPSAVYSSAPSPRTMRMNSSRVGLANGCRNALGIPGTVLSRCRPRRSAFRGPLLGGVGVREHEGRTHT